MAKIQQYNSDVSKWASATKRKIKLEILRLVVSVGPGHNQQKVGVKKYAGEASRIDFNMPYYMVFVHKGAGRGYGGSKSGVFSSSTGKRKTNPLSMGRMGTGKRRAKPFFNPIVEEQFPELHDIVAIYHGEKVMAKIEKILIR
jgi:hypothetical protein